MSTDKTQEQLDAIFQQFPESFYFKMAKQLQPEQVIQYLKELLVRKEAEFIDNALNHLTPISILRMIERLERTKDFGVDPDHDLEREFNRPTSQFTKEVINQIQPEQQETKKISSKTKGKVFPPVANKS